ncbi:MAG: hypothetical protein K8I29_19460 [Alphaproteobacteria bacterium]|uniref:Lytic transglycosylase domain-containing protein n=1 Tax=Candidatus Nitrobium versatile TaxID=2884831 RepID=A0A953SH47_9BACT|nr:hypothetical protein [Candidatus Nitrobium versatile]
MKKGILLCILLLLTVLLAGSADAYPARAVKFFPVLKEEHRAAWPESDIGVLASQVAHESAWREAARRVEKSGVVSYGLLQVLDVTLKDMQKRHASLRGIEPVQMLQARWGIRAGIFYDREMWRLCFFAADETERYAMMLAAYNGGYGWLLRDRKLAEQKGHDKNRWFGHVELFSQRSREAFRINRRYPASILEHAEEYRRALRGI